MKSLLPRILIFSTLGLLSVAFLLPMLASPTLAQAYYYTPTPRADGRIIYTVKQNDTCISIALLNGISEQQLRELNNLVGAQGCVLQIGQELLLGVKQEDTPTPTSEVPPEPTPTPIPGNGTICIYLFNDLNGNAMAEEGEPALAGGAVSVTDRLSVVNKTGITLDTGEALCFEGIPEGDYNLSVAIPDGYNATTVTSYGLALKAGSVSTVDFGAQESSRNRPLAQEDRPSPLLAILGVVFIGIGVGLWFYMRRLNM